VALTTTIAGTFVHLLTLRIFPEIVPFPPPGLPRISIIVDSSAVPGDAAGCVDMKLRCCCDGDPNAAAVVVADGLRAATTPTDEQQAAAAVPVPCRPPRCLAIATVHRCKKIMVPTVSLSVLLSCRLWGVRRYCKTNEELC